MYVCIKVDYLLFKKLKTVKININYSGIEQLLMGFHNKYSKSSIVIIFINDFSDVSTRLAVISHFADNAKMSLLFNNIND